MDDRRIEAKMLGVLCYIYQRNKPPMGDRIDKSPAAVALEGSFEDLDWLSACYRGSES